MDNNLKTFADMAAGNGNYSPFDPTQFMPYQGNPLAYGAGPEHLFFQNAAPPPVAAPVVAPTGIAGLATPGNGTDLSFLNDGGGEESKFERDMKARRASAQDEISKAAKEGRQPATWAVSQQKGPNLSNLGLKNLRNPLLTAGGKAGLALMTAGPLGALASLIGSMASNKLGATDMSTNNAIKGRSYYEEKIPDRNNKNKNVTVGNKSYSQTELRAAARQANQNRNNGGRDSSKSYGTRSSTRGNRGSDFSARSSGSVSL